MSKVSGRAADPLREVLFLGPQGFARWRGKPSPANLAWGTWTSWEGGGSGSRGLSRSQARERFAAFWIGWLRRTTESFPTQQALERWSQQLTWVRRGRHQPLKQHIDQCKGSEGAMTHRNFDRSTKGVWSLCLILPVRAVMLQAAWQCPCLAFFQAYMGCF